jgi:hypothetical protein
VGEWNEAQAEAARRAWDASVAPGLDDETRRALERLSARYFFGACGLEMVGESDKGARQPPSPRTPHPGREQARIAGGRLRT